MEPSIFKYILKHTAKDQVFVLLLTALSMPFVYISLEIPKLIINEAIGGNVPESVLGYQFDQIQYLVVLSLVFLFLILINGGLKYVINVYRGVLGERMLRRFRFELYSRILRFPLPHFKRTSAGEIIPMVTAETEPLGGFIGDAFALPAFQGGLFLTYLFFIFNQDILLGLAAIALFPPQMWLIPKLQRKVNELMKRRVRTVRKLADRVSESVAGITEIHAHDTSRYERADVSSKLGTIYGIRFEIYRRKFFIKFLNNFLAQLTPFFFFSVGGYLVITGELSLGALVAVLAAYKDVIPPWKELLKFYQITEDIKVKYAQIIEQFQPQAMLPARVQDEIPEQIGSLEGELVSANLSYSEDEFTKQLDGASFKLKLGQHIAVAGANNSGKDELSRLIARLVQPSGGRLALNELEYSELPESVTGRRISYVGANSHIFNGSIEDNLYYGLKHLPIADNAYDEEAAKVRAEFMHDAEKSGNPSWDINAEWIDYPSTQVEDKNALQHWALECLRLVDFDEDIFELGLRSKIDPDANPELTQLILKGREELQHRLHEPEMADLVEFFDREKFNMNMSVAENVLFGAPLTEEFNIDRLSSNKIIMEIIESQGSTEEFLDTGRKIAEIMLDLFSDVAPDSEMFDQFSFISAEDLPEFSAMLGRHTKGALTKEDQQMLMALPFKLVPVRHRLGLINDESAERIIGLRKALRERLGENNEHIDFFTEDKVNSAINVQDNILFGRVAYGVGHAQARVTALLREIVENLGLHGDITVAGFKYEVGVAGARLSPIQRQKLAIARGLIKRPDLTIINEATATLDTNTEDKILNNIKSHLEGKGLLWVIGRGEMANSFDEVLVLDQGKVAEQGGPQQLAEKGGVYSRLLEQLA